MYDIDVSHSSRLERISTYHNQPNLLHISLQAHSQAIPSLQITPSVFLSTSL